MNPPRVRETLYKEQQKEKERKSRRARIIFMVGLPLLVIVVGLLAYGFLQRTVFRPRVDATIERTDMYVKAGEHIQVNVVNACGATGMASKFTEFLRARKFDVPEYSTATVKEPYSKVIDRVGDPLSAQKVAYALGIAPERIETEIDSSLYLRATVVIGEDYKGLRPMK